MPDLRGYGQTKVGPEQCTVAQMAADVVAFMDKLAVQQTLLIGFSMGGMVALYLEAFYAERVQGACCISTAACANLSRIVHWHDDPKSQQPESSTLGIGEAMYLSASRMPSGKMLNSQDALDVFGLTLDPNKPAFPPMASALAQYPDLPNGPLSAPGIVAGPMTGLPSVTEPMPGLAIILRHPVPAWVIQSYTRDLVTLDLGPHLHERVKAPTLLIWGEFDMLFTPYDRAYTTSALPAAQVKEYAKGSHFVHAEKEHMCTMVKDILHFFEDNNLLLCDDEDDPFA